MDNISIERVEPKNLNEALAYLEMYEETSQFLINNLKQYGSKLADQRHSLI